MVRAGMDLTGNINFTDNYAAGSGGGAALDDSTVAFSGLSSFTGNIARHSGGAVATILGSIVSFAGNTTFHKNSCSYWH